MNPEISSLAEQLKRSGLEYAFGITGSGLSLNLITELENLGVQYYSLSHEASAALAAGIVSKITNSTSISISIRGPGLANMLPGIAHNYFENNPALSISEALGFKIPRHKMHKRLDHRALLSSLVKGIGYLHDIDQNLDSLIKLSKCEVPGPIHIDLCERPPIVGHDYLLNENLPSPNNKKRQFIIGLISQSKKPALIIGSLGLRRIWGKDLSSLNIPVFTTASAKGALDEKLAHSAGVFTGEGKALALESNLFEESDLIIGLGLRNTEVLSPKRLAKPTIIIDEVDYGLAVGFQANASIIDADMDFMFNILNALKSKCWGIESIVRLKTALMTNLNCEKWLPSSVFDIMNHLSYACTLVIDTGSFCTIGEHMWLAGPGRSFIGSSNGRYMGTAVPTAVGAAICRRETPVFCVVGDGGIRTYPAEIKIAINERLPICFVLMTDGHFGSILSSLQNDFLSKKATTIVQPSWWSCMEGMGCEAIAVSSKKDFEYAIQSWNCTKPIFIEASFDPELYRTMTRELR